MSERMESQLPHMTRKGNAIICDYCGADVTIKKGWRVFDADIIEKVGIRHDCAAKAKARFATIRKLVGLNV